MIRPQSGKRTINAKPAPFAATTAFALALLACVVAVAGYPGSARAQETESLTEYRATLDRLETLEIYNEQLSRLIAAQKDEAEVLNAQIERAGTIERELVPLMFRMIDTLDEFVSFDLPFLTEERRSRVESLKAAMGRPEISPAEKFRRILEAYQVETEYGRTIGTYQAVVKDSDGGQRTVEVLRIGRIALLHRTLDGENAAMWHNKSRNWVELGSEYEPAIERGVRMARKQTPLDILVLPVHLPREEAEATEAESSE